MTSPIVKVEQGEVQGGEGMTENGKKYFYFKGIPYAEPPVGDLRFKDPVPVKPWLGKRLALEEGSQCAQLSTINMTDVIGGEDCLFVNVYTPSLPQNPFGKKLPVMVYIHGGGFRIGSGNAEEFRTDLLVEKETIVVTLNYRLGVLGFLCLDVPEVPGNAGLKDQTLAMAWVKRNIKSFDGNPNNITIFGCSAGAASIEYQMLSPLSKGLFHKAILESGSTLNPWARNNNPSQLVKKLKTVLNVTINDNVVLIQHLQDLDVNELIKSANKIIDETAIKAGELFGFAPVVEKTFANVDTFLTAEPLEILKVGKFHKVPIITGFCSNEGSLFKLFYGTHLRNLKAEKYADYMTSFSIGIGDKPKMNSELATLYNSSNRSDNEKVDNYLSDMLFIAGIEKSLHYYLQHGVYGFCYLFSYKGSFEFNLAKFKNLGDGARHGSELLYLSKLPTINESEATAIDLKVRRQLVEMWTNFAKFGNPTPEPSSSELIKWTAITKDKYNVLEINNELTMIPFPWEERVKLWSKIDLPNSI